MGGSDGAYMLSTTRRCVQEVARLSRSQDTDSILRGIRDRCYDSGQPSGGWESLDATLVFRATRPTGYTINIQVGQPAGGMGLTIAGSARCTNYPMNCLRSYFMDETGAVHGTPEPRPATSDDPLVPACESTSTPCDSTLLK